MSLNPIIALDHVIEEYRDHLQSALPAALDELKSLGLAAFTKKHDQYWNIPFNENLPQPVIDLPMPAAATDEAPRHRAGELFDFQTTVAPPGSSNLFTEQVVMLPKRSRRKS